jgi:hypothetical protein
VAAVNRLSRMSRPRVLARAATSILLFLLGACGDPRSYPGDPRSEPGPARYEADGTVLEAPDHGAELCLGGVADSYPPQCSGLPIADWDWTKVKGEESASGTTWGMFHLMGTFDGGAFTVLEVGVYEPPASGPTDFTAPCPEPAGGWVAVDLARATDADLRAVMRAAEGEPDSAGFWIDYVDEPSEVTLDGGIIAIASFTGDLERHEADLRELWGGPLCVTQQELTQAELDRIQEELSGEVGSSLGLQVTWSAGSVVDNRVEVGVVVASEGVVAAVEERYGTGAVLLVPALEPVQAG